MEVKESFVFQSDSESVNAVYNSEQNYLIAYHEHVPKEYCILYFSSNNIYFPNTEAVFQESIRKKNRFEWFGTRIQKGHKHIFIRDIQKQWYLTGINRDINTPLKLIEFLKKETAGYKIIALGSSAGGFAAVLFGQVLKAESILTFNGQYEVRTLLDTSTEQLDPVLFRNKNNKELLPFYDTVNFITKPETIFYFYSNKSKWDMPQRMHVAKQNMNVIAFNTSHHGIPFFKTNLPSVLNADTSRWKELAGKDHWPILFSVKSVGFFNTMKTMAGVANVVLKRFLHIKS